MSIEIAAWKLRCNDCNVVYSDEFHTEQTAREVEEFTGGRCSDCLRKHNLAAAIDQYDSGATR